MKWLGVSIIGCMVLLAIIIPWFFPYDFSALNLSQSLQSPSWNHIFGLDENGQDLLLKIIYGSRLSLFVTFSVLAISLIIGVVLGMLAGFLGSYVEIVIMALADMVFAFPKFLLALTLLAMMGSSVGHLIFALSFSTWAGFARLVRGEVKHLKEREFVWSVKAQGGSGFLQLRKHILPHLFGLLAVHSMFQAVAVLIAESGLNFLGLGSSLEVPSLGGLLSSARGSILEAPHLLLFPSLFLFLFLLSLNLIGESLRAHFDPYKVL